jgi:hypothetical protein
LEHLERRDCPSCTVFQKGETLFVVGDKSDNHIAIADTREGGVAVSCDGGAPQMFAGVKQWDMKTLAGDDEITATLSAPGDSTFHFRADLGAGNDRLSISGFDPQPDPPLRRVSFDIDAGTGDDEIIAVCPSDGYFEFRADLGDGNDTSHVTFDPQPDPPAPARIGAAAAGRLQLEVHGGQGDDRMTLEIGAAGDARLRVLFDAYLYANFAGGAGDDEFTLNVSDVTLDGHFTLSTDGGAGNDSGLLEFDNVGVDCALTMNLDRGAGDDTHRWDLRDIDISRPVAVTDRGGQGADRTNLYYRWHIAPGARVDFSILGAAGDDVITTRAKSHIEAGGVFAFVADGGAGDDQITFDYYDALVEGVAHVHLRGGAGADVISNEVEDMNIAGELAVFADGGTGDDVFHEVVIPCILKGRIELAFDGGAGDDQFMLDVRRGEGDVVDGEFMLSAVGGAGNDVMQSFIDPRFLPTGRGTLVFDGEAGNDRISVEVMQDEDDTGALDIRVLGGLGDDDLRLALFGVEHLSFLAALVDGGRGHDVAHVTQNVRVVNCEKVFFLDEPR